MKSQGSIAFTAPHHLASAAGFALLEQGASAIDAMIAAAAAITVAYPHMNSLGGDGFWLIHAPGEKPIAIDACGNAAALADQNFYAGHSSIPTRGGPAALTMAGTLDGWRCAQEWQSQRGIASRPLAELLAPALRMAEEGIVVTKSLQMASEKVAADLAQLGAYQRVFCPAGRTLQEGDTLRNPGLAQLLRVLSERGTDEFYRGDLAVELARWLHANGSPLRAGDFAAYRARIVDPLSVRVRAATIYNLPPPTQGLASLLILGIYDRLEEKYQPQCEAEHLHLLVEAIKQAFVVRDKTICDPAHLAAGWDSHLTEEGVAALAAAVDPKQASPWPRVAKPGDTVWMGAVDGSGLMVSFIQSVYWEFGSGLVNEDYGLTWNNRGLSFSLDPGHVNTLRPGCKPFHTLNPAFAIFDDGRRLSYGTMGGEGQPQTQSAVFSRYAYQNLSLQEAIARGRWLLGRTWGDSSHDLKLEADLAEVAGEGLRALGHNFRVVPACNEMMGHAGAIALDADGAVEAATDPRSDGRAYARNAKQERK